MSEPYKPLFNRTYLTVIVWLSALAVLYLSTLGDNAPDYLELEPGASEQVYWVERDGETSELAILLPTGSALTTAETERQTLLAQVVESRLGAAGLPDDIHQRVVIASDHIEVALAWPTDQPLPALDPLLTVLTAPVDATQWQRVQEKLRARTHLHSHKPESRLLAAFFDTLTGSTSDALPDLNSHYQSAFASARYLISGEDAEELAGQLSEVPGLGSPPQTLPPRTLHNPPTDIRLVQAPDRRYRMLLGSALPPRNHAHFAEHRLAALTLQSALNEPDRQNRFEYRLLWSSLLDGGYQALLLSGEVPLEDQLTAITNRISAERVEAVRKGAIDDWLEQMSDEQRQLAALKLVVLYGLPLQTLAQYADELAQPDSAAVAERARQSLSPDHQIVIRF